MLRDFAGRWKASIEAMHREVAAQVPEPGCSRELLQVRLVEQHVHACMDAVFRMSHGNVGDAGTDG